MQILTRFMLSALLFLAGPLLAAQDRPIALKAPTVLDGKGQTIRNKIIVVEGSKIVRIGGSVPAGAITYDLTGLTVTPGWIDTHSHIIAYFENGIAHLDLGPVPGSDKPTLQGMLHSVDNATLMLNAGFTTIQSPGAPEDKFLRDAIARGIISGPRILTSLQPFTENSGTPAEIRELVRERKQQGADFIKIFASKSIREGGAQAMTDEQIQAACGEAKAQGLRVIVHAQSAESAKSATLAGCTSIEHGVYLTDEVFNLMAQQGTYYDPNIGLLFQNFLENKAKFFGMGNFNAEGFAIMERNLPVALDTFKRALTHKDLKIIYGTDAVAGAHGRDYEEFIRRVRDGGQDPMAAVVSVTSLSAQSLGLQDMIGSIAPGMEADIVGFDGNPLQDVTAARRAVFVMKGGKVFENLGRGSKTSEAKK
jgi:imidazolonepropionase-like amidohydrolase